MTRVRLIHWNPEEAEAYVRKLQERGFEVEFESLSRDTIRIIREDPPDVIVIDLSRLPSQGRDIGFNLRKMKPTRSVPVVFAGGLPEKVDPIRQHFPDSTFSTWEQIQAAIKQAIANPPEDPVVPESVFEAYKGTPLLKKLGIQENSTVLLVNAPDNVEQTLGKLPGGVQLKREVEGTPEITLWFVRTREELVRDMEGMISFAADGGLWILWPKKASGVNSDVSQNIVRQIGLDSGLVDFKISAFDKVWSGLRFTRRKRDR